MFTMARSAIAETPNFFLIGDIVARQAAAN
jgi:hypothetical protein